MPSNSPVPVSVFAAAILLAAAQLAQAMTWEENFACLQTANLRPVHECANRFFGGQLAAALLNCELEAMQEYLKLAFVQCFEQHGYPLHKDAMCYDTRLLDAATRKVRARRSSGDPRIDRFDDCLNFYVDSLRREADQCHQSCRQTPTRDEEAVTAECLKSHSAEQQRANIAQRKSECMGYAFAVNPEKK